MKLTRSMRSTSNLPGRAPGAISVNPRAKPKNNGPSTCLIRRRSRSTAARSSSSAQGSSAKGLMVVCCSEISATFFMKMNAATIMPTATAVITPENTVNSRTRIISPASARGTFAM